MANPTNSEDTTGTKKIISPIVSSKDLAMFTSWPVILNTCNFPEGLDKPDIISRWLVIIRACVFSMTLFSGLIGGLLAIWAARVAGRDIFQLNWLNFVLATLAIVLCHAVNNMLNDYFDLKTGIDDSEYARALYAPHPILSGLTTKKRLLSVVLMFNIIFLAITVYFALTVSIWVFLFAILGLFLSIAYVAPPFKFKQRGLGEPSVFLVWGPLMIGVVFYVTYGSLMNWVLLATIPYALIVTTVLFGKHIDKLPADKAKNIHTLPVLVGERVARTINKLLMIGFYVLILVMVWYQMVGIGVLIVFLGVPHLITVLKVYSRPRPTVAPENWPVWPLWLVGWAFSHTRIAGGLLILGLIINLLLPPSFWFLPTIL